MNAFGRRICAVVVTCVAVGVGIAGCHEGAKRKDPLTADLVGARSLGIVQGEQSAFAPGDGYTLMKVDSAGNATPVFSQEVRTWGVVLTPTHVVATGEYLDIVDTTGTALDCYLVAVPLTASGEPVKCLSQVAVGNFVRSTNPLAPHDDDLGIAAKGSTVFFAIKATAEQKSEFRKWESGSDVTELLVQLDGTTGNQLQSVSASDRADNICVSAQGANTFPGKFICGESSGTTWAVVNTGDPFISEWIQTGPSIVTFQHRIDLTNLSVSDHGGGANLPWTRAKTFVFPEGGAVGVNSLGKFVGVASNGLLSIIDQSVSWERMISSGEYVWIFGGSNLQRFSITSRTLEPTNYLGTTQMLQVTSMAFTSFGSIRLDGTGAMGSPITVYISTNGAITSSTEDLPRYEAVVALP